MKTRVWNMFSGLFLVLALIGCSSLGLDTPINQDGTLGTYGDTTLVLEDGFIRSEGPDGQTYGTVAAPGVEGGNVDIPVGPDGAVVSVQVPPAATRGDVAVAVGSSLGGLFGIDPTLLLAGLTVLTQVFRKKTA